MKRCVLALAFASVALHGQNQPQIRQIDPGHVTILKDKPRGAYAIVVPEAVRPAVAPRARTCVAPLLAAPVPTDVDSKMPILHPPESISESAEIVKGLPPCWDDKLK